VYCDELKTDVTVCMQPAVLQDTGALNTTLLPGRGAMGMLVVTGFTISFG
jgi:hypothetical protein